MLNRKKYNSVPSQIKCPFSSLRLRLFFAHPIPMGEMRRTIARENDERMRDRFSSTLVIVAAIIAAVRLAREDIKLSPRVVSAVSDSVALARMILKRVVGS